MTKGQIVSQHLASLAMARYIDEIINTGHVKEATFDQTKDSALECVKQNIEASSLTERDKIVAKECVDKAINEIARMFKEEMAHSGRIV